MNWEIQLKCIVEGFINLNMCFIYDVSGNLVICVVVNWWQVKYVICVEVWNLSCGGPWALNIQGFYKYRCLYVYVCMCIHTQVYSSMHFSWNKSMCWLWFCLKTSQPQTWHFQYCLAAIVFTLSAFMPLVHIFNRIAWLAVWMSSRSIYIYMYTYVCMYVRQSV